MRALYCNPMGYPKRFTTGYVHCRPNEFGRDVFVKPNMRCNKKCPYYIFCMTELSKKNLGDRIKELRLSLQKPYYVFSIMENGDTFLLFEDEEGEQISFREKTMMGVTKKAEDYLEAMKIRSGQVAKIKEQQEKKDGPEQGSKTPPVLTGPPVPPIDEDDTVKTTSTVINGEGEKVKE